MWILDIYVLFTQRKTLRLVSSAYINGILTFYEQTRKTRRL